LNPETGELKLASFCNKRSVVSGGGQENAKLGAGGVLNPRSRIAPTFLLTPDF
jgi:hypothetical protein